MWKREPTGVETEPRCPRLRGMGLRTPIETVANDRHTKPSQMHAELMGPARHRLQFQKRPPIHVLISGGEQTPPCRRGPPEDRIDAGTGGPLRIRRQRQVHDPRGVCRHTVHRRLVPLLHRPRLECPAKRGPHLARAGQHEKTGRIAVEPMHRFESAEGRKQVRRDTRRIERCPRRHARHTGRLVDDDQIVVSKDNVDPVAFKRGLSRRRCRLKI